MTREKNPELLPPPLYEYSVGQLSSDGIVLNLIVLCPCILLKSSPGGSHDTSILNTGLLSIYNDSVMIIKYKKISVIYLINLNRSKTNFKIQC